MKPLILFLILFLAACPLMVAGKAVVVPVTGVVTTVADAPPQAALRKNTTRAERKLAKEVIRDAADACGMRRLEFMRAVNRGDVAATGELKLSLAEHEDAREIDIERLKEIFAMILDVIKQLMAIFSLFAQSDMILPDSQMIGMMALPCEIVPDQAKPDQVAGVDRHPMKRIRQAIDVRTPRVHVHVGKRVWARLHHRRALVA